MLNYNFHKKVETICCSLVMVVNGGESAKLLVAVDLLKKKKIQNTIITEYGHFKNDTCHY